MQSVNALTLDQVRIFHNYGIYLTHSHTTKFGPDQIKTFADDNLNVTKMIISVFDRGENIVGKGEIACLYKQFLLFPQYFQKASFPDPSKGVIVWEWVNRLPPGLCCMTSILFPIANNITNQLTYLG